MLKTCFLLFFFGAQSQGFLFRYPWHASCSLKWRVAEPCEQFKLKMINQIRDWEGDALCPGTSSTCPALPCGQRCLYDFVSVNGNEIKATHTTPVARYIDDLTFKLTSSGGACIVDANSNSRLWYAVLDKGTNYCNLRNLVDGAGYTETSLTEETNDGICTQYTSRDCSRF